MKLYLIRHAAAEDPDGKKYPDDAERPLSREGVKKFVAMSRMLKKLCIKVDLVVSSPLVRAQQTANIFSGFCGKDDFVVEPSVSPGFSYQQCLEIVKKYSGSASSIAIIGHEPDMGEITGKLITGKANYSLPYKKGAVSCIDISSDSLGKNEVNGNLVWFINTGLFKKIKK